jgi:Helicase associated domain
MLEQIGFLWRIKNNIDAVGSIQYPKREGKRSYSKQVPQQSSVKDPPAQSKPKKRSKITAPVIVSDSDKDSISLVSCRSYEVLTPPLAYDPHELDFDLMMTRLQSFQQQYGQDEVPPDYSALALGPWLVAMKTQARVGQLPNDQVQRLIDAGIVMIHGESQIWLECFWELRDFVMRFGHSQVSELDNPSLAAWAAVQRRRYSLGKLSETRKIRLQNIGFEFGGPSCISESASNSHFSKHTSGIEKDDLKACELRVDLLAAAAAWLPISLPRSMSH